MTAASRFDEEFAEVLMRIEQLEDRFNKHNRIRIQQWVRKLEAIQCNQLWKRNRNSYGRLLVACMESGGLIEPFSRMPPQGSLPNLKDHEIKQQQELIVQAEKQAHGQADRRREGTRPRSTEKHYRSGVNLSSKKKEIHQHIRMFEDSIGEPHHSTRLKLSRYRVRVNNLQREVAESRKLLLQAEEFLRKHNTRFHGQRNAGKREYEQLVDALRTFNTAGDRHLQSDFNEETQVRVFHSEDEIENLKFGLS